MGLKSLGTRPENEIMAEKVSKLQGVLELFCLHHNQFCDDLLLQALLCRISRLSFHQLQKAEVKRHLDFGL